MSLHPAKNIALTGFMGVGKSAVGRQLARRLKRRFVDLDRAIEKSAGLKVKQLFKQRGESAFRNLEQTVLAEILNEGRQVIATGGGAILNDQNLKLLKENAFVICLTASPDVIMKRVGNGAKRPLLAGTNRQERIEGLLKEREARYSLAHASIDTSDLTVDQVVEKIVQFLNGKSNL
ncbi:MAG TPA: shikimate kinase [Candidatus Binatia bacterium]